MLKTYGSNNLYFFFFFESRNKCFRIWCYSFTCCITNIIVSALWMRHQASNWRPKRVPGRVREPVGMSLLPAGPAPGERRSRLQTHGEFLIARHTRAAYVQSSGHWTNTRRKQTSTATSNSLPTVNKAEMGVARRPIHHHPATPNISGLLVNHLIYRVTVSRHASPLFPRPQLFVIPWSITTLWADPASPGISRWSLLRS